MSDQIIRHKEGPAHRLGSEFVQVLVEGRIRYCPGILFVKLPLVGLGWQVQWLTAVVGECSFFGEYKHLTMATACRCASRSSNWQRLQ